MQDYPWAVNKNKLQRAISAAGGRGEGSVKEYYIKLGGLVAEQKVTGEVGKTVSTETTKEPQIQTVESAEVEQPKKRGRKKKDETLQ